MKLQKSTTQTRWERIARKTIYSMPFLKVYEDRIKLPNGNIHERYSIVQFPDIVVIVATDRKSEVITITEYKYGADKFMRSFPAGHIEKNEDVIAAAKRELLEETGYGEGEFEYVGELRQFATKNLAVAYVVRAINVKEVASQNLDKNEELDVSLITTSQLHQEVLDHKWEGASEVAAMTLTNILNS